MSITIGDKPEQNVVNVGDEISADQLAAIQNSSAPSAANPLMTSTAVASAVPLASTSTAGKIQLATDAEAIAGTSTAKAITPAGIDANRFATAYNEYDVTPYTWFTATSGGAFVGQNPLTKFVNTFTAVGYGTAYVNGCFNQRGQVATAGIDWSKRVFFTCRVAGQPPAFSTNTHRWMLGKSTSSGVAGDLSVRGIGVKLSNGALQLMAHDGSNLTVVSTSFTPTSTQAYDLKVESDGAGNVTCYVNGTSVGTTTGGPTTIGSATQYGLFIESESTSATQTTAQIFVANFKTFIGY